MLEGEEEVLEEGEVGCPAEEEGIKVVECQREEAMGMAMILIVIGDHTPRRLTSWVAPTPPRTPTLNTINNICNIINHIITTTSPTTTRLRHMHLPTTLTLILT